MMTETLRDGFFSTRKVFKKTKPPSLVRSMPGRRREVSRYSFTRFFVRHAYLRNGAAARFPPKRRDADTPFTSARVPIATLLLQLHGWKLKER